MINNCGLTLELACVIFCELPDLYGLVTRTITRKRAL